MDISLLDKESIRIKTKQATFILNPSSSMPKTETDAVIFFDRGLTASSKTEGSRLTISGPGEYEVNGVKVSGIRVNRDTVFFLDGDNIKLLIGRASVVAKNSDSLGETHLALLKADSGDASVVAKIGPRVVLFYGDQKEEYLKGLGKEVAAVSKYSVVFEKLPEEMEVVSLG